MPHADRIRPLAAPRGRASRSALPAQAAGEWVAEGGWLTHRCAQSVRRVPLDLVLAVLDTLASQGALRPDGTLDTDRVRGVRAHHAVHGRHHVELRGPRWELVWCPRGGAAQRLPLAGVVEQVRIRAWSRDAA